MMSTSSRTRKVPQNEQARAFSYNIFDMNEDQ